MKFEVADQITANELEALAKLSDVNNQIEVEVESTSRTAAVAEALKPLRPSAPDVHVGPLTPRALAQSLHAMQNVKETLTDKSVIGGIQYIVMADLAHGFNLRVLGEFVQRALDSATGGKDAADHGDTFEAILAAFTQSPLDARAPRQEKDEKTGEVMEVIIFHSPLERLAHALYGADLFETKTENRQNKAVRRVNNALSAYKGVVKEQETLSFQKMQEEFKAVNPEIPLDANDLLAAEAEKSAAAAKQGAPRSAKEAFIALYNIAARVIDKETGKLDLVKTLENRTWLRDMYLSAGYTAAQLREWQEKANVTEQKRAVANGK